MAGYTYASEIVLGELLRISSGIVWKNPKKALAGESSEYTIMVEQYTLARQGRLSFDTIYHFDEEVLISCGMSREDAERCTDNPYYIPEDLRPMITEKQRDYILETYDEPNNYYRMLNGLPDKEDSKFFYNTEYPNISDSDTPIHQLDQYQLYELQSVGYLGTLIEENPDKPYLQYLTDKKIDPYLARSTEDYGILWTPKSNYTTMVEEFRSTYNACRYMVTTVYTLRNLSNENEEYHGFIGLVILFATINQMHQKFLDADITREFYDEDSLRYIYDSYGVPFYSSIPIEYHKDIVKNINRLISQKGSTQVVYSLFDIFGLSEMSIFEYYMMKIHKFDNGKPVFAKDKDGNPDYRKMYDLKFAKVKLYNDPASEVSDFQNHLDYEELTSTDPYWISDEELLNKLYREEFNYTESKYLGLQTTFNLMKIIYESSYYIKMIIDNKKYLSATTVYNNNTKENCNLFDLVIYLCALLCRKFGFEGNIPSDPHMIGKVMGFNFKEDFVLLKKNISENDYLKNDSKLLDFLETMNVDSIDSIHTVYTKLTSLRSYLTNKMWETDQPDVYWAYYELYNTIMYSEYIDGVFTKRDGTAAESFADMLSDVNQSLFYRYETPDMYDEDVEISDMLYLLKSSCSALSQIQYIDDVNIDILIEYLFKLVEFFKSAKADITGYTVIFSLVSNSENIMKLMNYIDHIVANHKPIYSIVDEMSDIIVLYREFSKFKDELLILIDDLKLETSKTLVWSQIHRLEDYMMTISVLIKDTVSELDLSEELHMIESARLPLDDMGFEDSVSLLYDEVQEVLRFLVLEEFPLEDILCSMEERIHFLEEADFSFSDEVTTFLSIVLSGGSITHQDKITDEFSLIWTESESIWNTLIHYIFEKRIISDSNDFKEILSGFDRKGYLTENHDRISFNDRISHMDEVYLTVDMGNNRIQYLDTIRQFFTKYYEEDFLILHDKIALSEITHGRTSELYQFDMDFFGKENSYLKTNATMTDMLILRSEQIIEEE